ncbi:MAG: antibiotic biosynthesis monooxygenase [Alphaproteobacteria bacterium]|nr:antibiotic biosynthesis monooxygenase [Alphaproteobacteria bacterium]
MQSVHIVAVIKAKTGLRQDLLKLFLDNVPLVLAEDGCIQYQPVIDTEDGGSIQTKFGDDTFVVVEEWESMEALRAHASSEHMLAYAGKSKDLIADRTIHILSPV